MLALIDGDVCAYQIGYTTENDPEWIARARMRERIGSVLQATGAADCRIFLSDSKANWRLGIFPNYKANRTQPKPKHLPYLQQLLVDEWDAEVAFEEEADDALGITQTFHNENGSYQDYDYGDSIICSIDKDLKQIPGYHYNWDKKEISFIEPSEGLYRFYYQLLTGDPGDNITVKEGLSCPGIGDKKAFQHLEGCETEHEMYETCRELYHRQWPKTNPLVNPDDVLLLTGKLIKIRTKVGEIWSPPALKAEQP